MATEPRPGKGGPRRGASRKGIFGRPKLPVTRSYVRPISRAPMLWLGILVALVLAVVGWLDNRWGHQGLISGGPLSSAHALLESDCAACHTGFEPVADTACATCHEQLGDDLGRYSFATHTLYRSADFDRLAAHDLEPTCASCHLEHGGRTAVLTEVADATCAACHERSAFDDDHPDFAFTGDPSGDDDALTFAHGHHVREVMDQRGFADVERACLECHEPEASGRGFLALDFDRHCDACHLDQGVSTPRLATAADGAPGVASLATIQASAEPGTDWAFYLDPNEFREVGGGRLVSKSPLHHRDPWVLYNLRRLRQLVYPDAGLADLLTASPDVGAHQTAELYSEALDTLEGYARGLRGSPDPEVQRQLATLEAVMGKVREAIADPTAPFDPSEFLLALEQPAPLDAELREEIDLLVADLTSACSVCHQVDRLTIARVENRQKTLERAEFDHRAHVIQRRCLDCHGQLPILAAVSGEEIPPELDRAEIHNLPGIDSCRACHQGGLTSSQCTTCHLYHPEAGRHADLLLYQD